MTLGPGEKVIRVDACDLTVHEGEWKFARENAAQIDARWQQLRREHPHYFNGTIFFMQSASTELGVLSARFLKGDFKSFLYWRETGPGDKSVADGFGSALIRSAEGYALLGRQRAGHVNGGLVYLPGGFIDERDVDDKGAIDIDASIRRELAEETGLIASDLVRAPGYYVTFAGNAVSIAAEFRSALGAEELRRSILSHIALEEDAELADVVVVRSADDLAALNMPPYAGPLLRRVFADTLMPPGRAPSCLEREPE